MSAKDKFTPEEWKTLLQTPILVGFAVIGSSPSGAVGFVKEMAAIADALIEGGQQSTPDSLLGSVVAEIQANPKALVEEQKDKPSAAAAKAKTLEACRQTAQTLGEKVSEDEAKAYKQWLIVLGRKVSEASKEGGFLGMGGVQVSESETAVLGEISSALGISG